MREGQSKDLWKERKEGGRNRNSSIAQAGSEVLLFCEIVEIAFDYLETMGPSREPSSIPNRGMAARTWLQQSTIARRCWPCKACTT